MKSLVCGRRRWTFGVASMVVLWSPLLLADDAKPEPVRYTLSIQRPQTQTLKVVVEVVDVDGEFLDLALPVWRPGRYVVLDFAGTVRRVWALDEAGRQLDCSKLDKTTWRVMTGGSNVVRVSFEIYANSLNDRTRHVDATHAFIDGSSVFAYVKGRRDHPVTVQVESPDDWRVTTGMKAAEGSLHSFSASNYDELIDCPLEIGTHELRRFEVAGVPHELAIWGRAHHDFTGIEDDMAKIAEVQREFWGDFPYDRYVFLLHIGPARGGTEHRNSTILQVSREAFDRPKAYLSFLSLVSHELFHAWNVKALRPAGISRYRYEGEDYTKLLWVSEGSTSYYSDLILVRAGLMKPKTYLKELSERIDGFRRRPGRQVQSLEASSFDAWIKFNKQTADSSNSTVSFYTKGALVSWLLDFELRRRTVNRVSYDTVMAEMYRSYPLSSGGFSPEDMLRTIERLAGSDFGEFWGDYISGTRELDFETYVSVAGLELTLKPKRDEEDGDLAGDEEDESAGDDDETEVQQEADLGISLREDHGRLVVKSVRSDGPAYAAGVNAGDELLALDGLRLHEPSLGKRLKKYDPGAEVELALFRHDVLETVTVQLGGRPKAEWVLRHVEAPTASQRAVYESWLGRDWPAQQDDDASATEE